jgi:hypothetical protein
VLHWYQSQRILQKNPKKKNSPILFARFGFAAAMDASETGAVATPAVSLDQMLARSKRIDELLKSTSDSLAQIARLQNSTQRIWDSRPRRLKSTEQLVQANTPTSSRTTPLVHVPTMCSTSRVEEKQHLSAHHMFDERSGRQKLTASHVLLVTVTCVLYPVTEKVLHQVFDRYGVNEICVLQHTHSKAVVEFQSWHEASKARGDLNGQCVYDGCCLLDIQYAQSSISIHRLPNSKMVVVDWDRAEVEPLTSSQPRSASSAATTIIDKDLNSKEVVGLQAALLGNSSAVKPMATLALDTNPDTSVNDISDVVAPTPTKGSTDCSEDDNNDDVFTHVAGISIFLELWLDYVDDGIGNSVLTHVGGLSIFLEQPMNSLMESANVISATGYFTKERTTECICDEKFRLPVLVLLNSDEKNDNLWHLQVQEPYKCRDFCCSIYSGWYFQYKKWDPGVWISVAEVTDIGTIGACDT